MRGPGLSSEFDEVDQPSVGIPHALPLRGGGFKRYAHSAGPVPEDWRVGGLGKGSFRVSRGPVGSIRPHFELFRVLYGSSIIPYYSIL